MSTYLLKGGRVIDPASQLDAVRDVLIENGQIKKIDTAITEKNAQVLQATDYLVVPGLIDLHTHVYGGGTSVSVHPDVVYKRSGCTTLVDAGSSGAGNFLGFYEQIIKPSCINIFAFLNISFAGIFGFSRRVMFGEASLLELMHIEEAVEMCRRYPELIVGIKVRACQRAARHLGTVAMDLGLEAAAQTNLPVMTHLGYPPPRLEEIVKKLRAGDIITHAFRDLPNSAVTEQDEILPCLFEARKRGIYLDIGHGMGGFGFRVAKRLAQEGFWPDTISSDVHVLSVDGPAFDLLTTMSKFLCLGMPLPLLIASVTTTPAKIIKKPLGTLAPGSAADVTVLKIEEGEFLYQDGAQQTLKGTQRFAVKALFKGGQPLF